MLFTPPAGADDQDGLPGPQAGPVDQHAPGGQPDQQRGGRLREIHPLGHGARLPAGTATYSAAPPRTCSPRTW